MINQRQIILAAAVAVSFSGNAFAADQKVVLASVGDVNDKVVVTKTNPLAPGQKVVLASLGEVNGKVLVNKGKGYVTAKQGMEIRPGDRVVALDKASAKVVYNDGCVTDLKENDLLSMDGKGCANSAISARPDSIKLAQAIGGTATDAGGGAGGAGGAGAGAGAGGAGAVPFIIGGVVLGVAAIATGSSGSSDNTPISGQ